MRQVEVARVESWEETAWDGCGSSMSNGDNGFVKEEEDGARAGE